MLDVLIQWVRAYESRDDEYGLKRHRHVFDTFTGAKKEYTSVASYDEGYQGAPPDGNAAALHDRR